MNTVSVVFNFVWQTVHWKEEQTPAFTLTIWLPLLVTNMVATGLVALQVWYVSQLTCGWDSKGLTGLPGTIVVIFNAPLVNGGRQHA